jgi:hypothetical protein
MVNVLEEEKFVMVKQIVPMVEMKIQDFVVRKERFKKNIF